MDSMSIDWPAVFVEAHPRPRASEEDLAVALADLKRPLSEEEAAAVARSQSNPFPRDDPLHAAWRPFDARRWRVPKGPLPPSYLSFLRWADGGSFANGGRRFDPFFPCSRLREYLLAYHVPQYMPGTLPFAFDGGGCFYLFDMRGKSVRGEFPVLYVGAGNLNFADAVTVASSFLEACRGTTDPADRYMQ
jgi:SMI1 / KNR4 family (SUKH-1)